MISSHFGIASLNSLKIVRSLLFGMAVENSRDNVVQKLRMKITKASNVYTLLKTFEESREHFSPVFVQASAKMITLLDGDKNYNRQSLFNFYSEIRKIKVDMLTQEELITMLSILRKYQTLGFRNFKEQKNALLQAFKKLMNKKKYTQVYQLEQLCSYYELLSFYHDYVIQRLIFTNIYHILSRQVLKQRQVQISTRSIAKYFKGLYYIEQSSFRERLIRATLLSKIQSSIQKIEIQDLVEICVNLLRIDELDFQNRELMILNKLIQKLNKQVQNLTKDDLLRLLNIQDNKMNRARIISLYKSIANRLFQIIEADGTTKIPYIQILDFLCVFCEKLKFHQIKQSDQQKQYNFLQRVVVNEPENKQVRAKLMKYLIHVIKHKFFDEKYRSKLQKIVDQIAFTVNIQLLYLLSINQFDTSNVLKTFKLFPNSKIQHTFMYGIALKCNQKIKKDEQLKGLLTKTQQDLQKTFSDPQLFIKFVISSNIYQDSEQLFYQIYRHFSDLFEKIQNPFKKEMNNYEYTIAYTQFAIKIIPQDYTRASKIFQFNYRQIPYKLLKDLIMRELRQNKYTIKPMKELFYIIASNQEKLMADKNSGLLKSIISLMIRCSRFLVYKSIDIYHEEIFWKIIRFFGYNIKNLNEMGLNKEINYLFSCYLAKSFKHYSHSKEYADIVSRLLENLAVFSSNLTTLNVLFPAALALGLLEGKHCDKDIIQKIDFNRTEKQKIRVLMEQNHEGKLEYMPKTNLYDLEPLVMNKKAIKIIEQNIENILEKLPKYSDYQLIALLASFKLPNTPTSRRLLNRILRVLVNHNKNMQNFDMGRVFLRALEGFYFMIDEYNQLFYRLLANYLTYRARLKYIDTFTFIQYARFAASQPEKKEMASFYEVAQQWLTINTPNNQIFLLCALVETSFQFTDKHLEMIPKAIQLYFKAGVKMFLCLQDRLSVQKRKEIVRLIVSLIKSQSRFTKITDFYYHYLKKVYPQETKTLHLDKEKLDDFYFATKPNPKVMQALQDVKSKLGLQLKVHRNFGGNEVFELNDTFIVFISPAKTSSVHERKFLKKGIKILMNRKIPVLDFLNSLVKDQSIYLKLIKSKGIILSEEQVEELIRKSQVEVQFEVDHQKSNESKHTNKGN